MSRKDATLQNRAVDCCALLCWWRWTATRAVATIGFVYGRYFALFVTCLQENEPVNTENSSFLQGRRAPRLKSLALSRADGGGWETAPGHGEVLASNG